ncbi:hypothetical protein KIN20_035022 [Parelaphostrongylus tenuis]|uniref:C2H2-type domain-containing protein n=1 Tax=Parelaphostrongylus tenuis TaxID=148309 RepID=A0AAD5RAW4_PARTN|nr:hypothetical protein KIN20_035022 [Parelaphostrongylus tenuis]
MDIMSNPTRSPKNLEENKTMCEEINCDEIQAASEMEADAKNNDEIVKQQNETEATATQGSGEGDDNSTTTGESSSNNNNNNSKINDDNGGKASHPPNEIVENVMRHVASSLSKAREKKSTTEQSQSSKKRSHSKKKRQKGTRTSSSSSDSDSSRSSRSRSRSRRRSGHRRRRTPPRKRARSSSSSSRGTYDGFDFFLPEDECPYSCKQCRRGFYTIKELAEHEIRAHDMKIPCAHCDKNAISVTKLAAHMLFRHPTQDAECYYCEEVFGGTAEKLDKSEWDEFRAHVYKEVLKKRVHEHTSKTRGSSSDAVALRGVGRCPHGAAVKCKNFPNCPGPKCIYSHGQCRYDVTCNKSTCPFDHSNRPRVCMACVNDMKGERSRRRN